jgi:hypothetical protein
LALFGIGLHYDVSVDCVPRGTLGTRGTNNKFGTSAFTIIDTHDSSILGLKIVLGHPDHQGAFRSELAGLLLAGLFGIVLIVNLLCSWAGITSGGIAVGGCVMDFQLSSKPLTHDPWRTCRL